MSYVVGQHGHSLRSRVKRRHEDSVHRDQRIKALNHSVQDRVDRAQRIQLPHKNGNLSLIRAADTFHARSDRRISLHIAVPSVAKNIAHSNNYTIALPPFRGVTTDV